MVRNYAIQIFRVIIVKELNSGQMSRFGVKIHQVYADTEDSNQFVPLCNQTRVFLFTYAIPLVSNLRKVSLSLRKHAYI